MNCEWAAALTRYDCRTLSAKDGSACLEIGTPFSLPDGSAINLYLVDVGSHIRITDNADTVFQLGGMGLDLWSGHRLHSLREVALANKLQVTDAGEVFLLVQKAHTANGLAVAISGLLAISRWAAVQLAQVVPVIGLADELKAYVIARDPSATFEPHPKVKGASNTIHEFDYRHGADLIAVIPAHPNATGGAMRKAGDVQNGPFAEIATPLIIVDDRTEPERALTEIGILASVTRAVPASNIMRVLH